MRCVETANTLLAGKYVTVVLTTDVNKSKHTPVVRQFSFRLKQMQASIQFLSFCIEIFRDISASCIYLAGADSATPINIEPGLLEWHLLLSKIKYLDADELIHFRINVNKTYKPIIPFEKLNISETRLGEYDRGFLLARSIVERHKEPGIHEALVNFMHR